MHDCLDEKAEGRRQSTGAGLSSVIASIGTEHYAFSLESVVEVVLRVQTESLEGARPPVAGVMEHRGTKLVVVDIRARLSKRSVRPSIDDHFIVLDRIGQRVAFVVDRVVEISRGLPSAPDGMESMVDPWGALSHEELDALRAASESIAERCP